MNDLTKLPKWAQEHIRVLEIKLSVVEKQLEMSLLNNDKNGSGVVSIWNHLGRNITINDRSVIEFNINGSRITVSRRGEGNDCYVDVNGDFHLSISPRAANSCYIR
jgi:hypothetical protein